MSASRQYSVGEIMKIKLKDKKMDNAFSYRGFSIEDFNSLNKGGVVEVDFIPKHAKDFVKEVSSSSKPKVNKGDK
tara:strand:- start:402 stop:626 length:225 start_codon:yes stop_codon:yes gene_type:complete